MLSLKRPHSNRQTSSRLPNVLSLCLFESYSQWVKLTKYVTFFAFFADFSTFLQFLKICLLKLKVLGVISICAKFCDIWVCVTPWKYGCINLGYVWKPIRYSVKDTVEFLLKLDNINEREGNSELYQTSEIELSWKCIMCYE